MYYLIIVFIRIQIYMLSVINEIGHENLTSDKK